MTKPPRFYVAAASFGWGVHDREQGEHPNFRRVNAHWQSDHGGSSDPDSWERAHQAALADAAERNAAEEG